MIPFYGFTALLALGNSSLANSVQIIGGVIGLLVIAGQVSIAVFSIIFFATLRRHVSQAFLLLLGGSIIVFFMWAGGCVVVLVG